MKILKCIILVLYGSLVTFGVAFLLALTGAFSGWGDGTTNDVHHTSIWCACPTAIFYLAVSSLPFLPRKRFKGLLLLSGTILLFLDVILVGIGDGILIFGLCILALLRVLLLAASKPKEVPTYAKYGPLI